jgi:uncharacterized delta-60 repeat protein
MPDLSAFVPKGMTLRRTISTSGTNTVAFGARGVTQIWSHAQQSDGKIVIGGAFNSYNNTYASGITRIETNGELDTAFNTNIGTGALAVSTTQFIVTSVVIQTDGKILAGGYFDNFNGTSQAGLVRLNSTGTPDTAFNANVVNLIDRSVNNSYINSIALQSDGKIIIGGYFDNLLDSVGTGYSISYLARLNSNGTIDTTFSSDANNGPGNGVWEVVVQPDDKILVGQDASTWLSSGSSISTGYFVRLNSSGALDTTFNTALGTGVSSVAWGIALQSDGSIIIGGQFTDFNGTTCRIARISSSGTFDTSFNTNVGTGPNTFFVAYISVQSDGKILVGGDFTSWSGTTVGRIVRLNSDGTRDTAFTTANGSGANSRVGTTSQLSSGDIFVAGNFTTWNGESFEGLVTLTSAGAQTTTFLYQPDIVFAIAVGGGGRGGSQTSFVGGGGGAGAVVWGLVPARTNAVVGAGGTSSTSSGEDTIYSTLYANGGSPGSTGAPGSLGSGAGATSVTTGADVSTTIGGAGSTFYTSVGGAGGGYVRSGTADAIGLPGSSGTSGGGGGIGGASGANSFLAAGGTGGSGLVGGGGGGAACLSVSSTGPATGGNGGAGIYAGGTSSTITGTGTKFSAGSGGGGLLGAGGNGTTGTSSAIGGAGGLGGGGGGGGVNETAAVGAGVGGDGALLLYW